jgi:hypothetical protein
MAALKHKDTIVIAVVVNGEVESYYGIDQTSGGYPWFPKRLKQAEFFDNHEDAEKVVADYVEKAKHPKPDNHGVIYPHGDVYSLLQLSNSKPSGSVELMIVDLVQIPTSSVTISGEIKRPTGFIYD